MWLLVANGAAEAATSDGNDATENNEGDSAGGDSDADSEITQSQQRSRDTGSNSALFPTYSYLNRQLVINEVSYGTAAVWINQQKLSIDATAVAEMGLKCEARRSVQNKEFCQIAVPFTDDGNKLSVFAGEAAFMPGTLALRQRQAVPLVPEFEPGSLAFFGYDANLYRLSNGAVTLNGSLRPGLRLKENAFDASIFVSQTLQDSNPLGFTGTNQRSYVKVTHFAYRREWFEKRLRLTVGRDQIEPRGLLNLFGNVDGVSLRRFNSDNQGNLITAGARPIDGFAPGPGILQYRVGDKIYGQLPIASGRFEIGRDFISQFPRGGELELVGLDGVARPIDYVENEALTLEIFGKGTYEYDLQLGRTSGYIGHAPLLSANGRYGLSSDVTVGGGIISTDKAGSVGVDISARFPGAWGAIGVAAVVGKKWDGADQRTKASLQAQYFNRFGPVSVDLYHKQQFGGGAESTFLQDVTPSRFRLEQTSRVGLGFKLPGGFSSRFKAERFRYNNISTESRAVSLDIGKNFGKYGSGYLTGRIGKDQSGVVSKSVFLNWTASLGNRHGATISAGVSESGNANSNSNYRLSVFGSSGATTELGQQYDVSIDQDKRIAGNFGAQTPIGDFRLSAVRESGDLWSGSVNARGSVVLAGKDILLGRSIDSTVLVVRSPEIPGAKIFVKGYVDTRTELDGDGSALIPSLQPYRQTSFRADDKKLPLGMTLEKNNISGSVRPYRGYIVDIRARKSDPVRLFPLLPDAALVGGYIMFDDKYAPVEQDGSIYVEDLGAVKNGLLTVLWADGGPGKRCEIDVTSIAAKETGNALVMRDVRNIVCKIKD